VMWWHFGNVEEKWDARLLQHETAEASAATLSSVPTQS
jgi:hypothetical protein